MTKAKVVAKTIKGMLDNPLIAQIQDNSVNILPLVEKVQDFWGFDLYSRKPGPAYTDDGTFVGTNLDLAAFLYALVDRKAVINIPKYDAMRETKVTEGTRVLSKDNRHGQLINLVSNKETFIFSLRINDANVVTTEAVGEPRTFSLTEFDGSWYDGWQTLQFMPDAKENKFLEETKILTDNSIQFKNFIHPNRWTSFYGQYYIATKLMIDRLTAEAANYNKQVKRMLAAGISYPETEAPKVWPVSESVGNKKTIKVKAFEAIVDFPESTTEFPVYPDNVENLLMLTALRKQLVYTTIPRLRFMTRATEYAFYKHVEEKGLDSLPTWLKNVKWESDYVEKGKRTKWNRLVLFQPAPGERGVALRFRSWEKSEQVNENYAG